MQWIVIGMNNNKKLIAGAQIIEHNWLKGGFQDSVTSITLKPLYAQANCCQGNIF